MNGKFDNLTNQDLLAELINATVIKICLNNNEKVY